MGRSNRRRHYYHCTVDYHGEIWTAGKRVPVCVADKEPPVPRLCACTTIAACFSARLFDYGKPVFVYRTATPRKSVRPRDVWDQLITGERWLVPPVPMLLVDKISTGIVEEVVKFIRLYHRVTGQKSDFRLRLAMYGRAIEVLGPKCTNRYEQNWLRKALVGFQIGSPEEYILSRVMNGKAKTIA